MSKKLVFAVLFLIIGVSAFLLVSFRDIQAQTTALNFSMSLTPGAITMNKSNLTVTKTISIQTKLISGSTKSTSFSISGLPSGITLASKPNSCNLPCTSAAKITISPNVSAGNYNIIFTAKAGTTTQTSSLKLTITSPTTTTTTPTNTGGNTGNTTGNTNSNLKYTLSISKSGTGSGTIKSSPSGINCGSNCSQPYNQGTNITLTASASSGSEFVGWSGSCSGTGTCIVTMNENKSVSARFTKKDPQQVKGSGQIESNSTGAETNPPAPSTSDTTAVGNYILTISKSGNGTITSSPSGINCGSNCSQSYTKGTIVTLTAVASSGYGFTSWSGCISTSGATCTVSMDSNKTAKVIFTKTNTIQKSSITIVSPNGGEIIQLGTTHSIVWKMENPGKVKIYACKGTAFISCALLPNFPTNGVSTGAFGDINLGEYKFYIDSKSIYAGQKLKLKIVSVTNSSIYDFSDNYFTIAKTSTDIQPKLTILSPNGGETYKSGSYGEIKWISSGVTTVNIELIEKNSSTSWMLNYNYDASSGKLQWYPGFYSLKTDGDYMVRIYDAKNSTALDTSDNTFKIVKSDYTNSWRLTIEKSGNAYGVIKSDKGGIDCGGLCFDYYKEGTKIVLTATPSTWDSSFGGWTGDCTSNNTLEKTCTITMDKDRTIKAAFYSSTGDYNIVIEPSGTGTGVVTGPDINCGADCKTTIKNGVTLNLKAKADAGSRFVQWSGDGYGTYDEFSTIVKSSMNIKAIFDKDSGEVENKHITVNVTGSGENPGTVKSTPEGIDCESDCDASFLKGTDVKLTATANQGYIFGGWYGACSGVQTECFVKLDGDKTVNAWFYQNYQAPITVVYPNGGEHLSFNEPITIKWKSTSIVQKFNIYLENPEQQTYCLIAKDVPTTGGKYNITLAEDQLCLNFGNLKSGKYKVSLWGDYASSSVYGSSDMSDDYFNLTGRYISSKIETNSTWFQRSSYKITWESAGVDRVSVAAVCSDDTYYRIANNILASKNTTTWKIPTYKPFVNPCKIWIGEYKGLKNSGKWSDVSPSAYNYKYAETNVSILSNESSSIMDSLYGSLYYSILRFVPGF